MRRLRYAHLARLAEVIAWRSPRELRFTEDTSTLQEGAATEEVPMLGTEDRQVLLRIARTALSEYLGHGRRPQPRTDVPALQEHRAAFVTLRRRDTGVLRGCRGEVRPRQPLADSVAHMAIASATDDPRFDPVTSREVSDIRIDINALTPIALIAPDAIVIGRHGLMVVSPRGSGLLLPEVAERHEWDVPAFLRATCQKAGLPDEAWRESTTELYGFESEAWSEED